MRHERRLKGTQRAPGGRSALNPGVVLIVVCVLTAVWCITIPVRARLARETAQIKRQAALRSMTPNTWQTAQSSVQSAQEFVQAHPKDPGARLALAAAWVKQGDDRSAITEARVAEELAPSSAGPHDALGDLYDRVGEPDLALDELRKASAVAPLDTGAASLLAYKYLSFGWTHDAETVLRRALAKSPNAANLHATLGLVYFQNRDMDSAERELLTARRLAPEDRSLFAPLIDVYLRWGKPTVAAGLVDEALRAAPNDPELLTRYAQMRMDAGDTSGALAAANRALQMEPTSPKALYVRALAEKAQGDRAAAIKDIQAVADASPNADALRMLGQLYLQTGDKQRALQCVQQADKVQADSIPFERYVTAGRNRPNDSTVHLALARYYHSLHKDALAIVEAKRALELHSGDPSARALLVEAFAACGRSSEAH